MSAMYKGFSEEREFGVADVMAAVKETGIRHLFTYSFMPSVQPDDYPMAARFDDARRARARADARYSATSRMNRSAAATWASDVSAANQRTSSSTSRSAHF